MKCFIKEFLKRGLISFGFGPIIVAIVYLCLSLAGIEDSLTLAEVAKQILLVSVMAFLAAGATAIYQIERIALPFAVFIHGLVLYVDYIAVYLMNGWIEKSFIPIIVFTAIFIVGFVIIWIIAYFVNKVAAKRLNESLNDK